MSPGESAAHGRRAGHRIVRMLSIAALQLALALALAEVGLRLFRPAPRGDNRLLRHDAELGYLLAPDLDLVFDGGDYQMRLSTDGRGARRHPAESRPVAASITILAIGDSYTYSGGVSDDETYPYFLQQALARQLPAFGVEVVNLGVGGYGLAQARRLGLRHLDAIDPDLVLLMMCSNDPEDDLGFQLGYDHSRGQHVDPAAYDGHPTELRRYFDIVLKKLDVWRPLWLPAWRIPLREEQWRRLAPTYPDLVRSEFAALAAMTGPRPLVTSLINYHLLHDASAPASYLRSGSTEALQREMLFEYLATAQRWSHHVPLGGMQDGLYHHDGSKRAGLWNTHSGGHLSPRGNRAVAELLAPALIRELRQRSSILSAAESP